ncbi:MAG: hypothetical protein ABIN69_05950, partial [Aestuariivirga sp.]
PASKQKSAARAALAISDLLPVSRDFGFVVDDKVQAAELLKAVKGVDKVLIADAQVFDVYKLEGGKTSLAVEVTLQPREKTFNDAEIEALSAKIVAAAQKSSGSHVARIGAGHDTSNRNRLEEAEGPSQGAKAGHAQSLCERRQAL